MSDLLNRETESQAETEGHPHGAVDADTEITKRSQSAREKHAVLESVDALTPPSSRPVHRSTGEGPARGARWKITKRSHSEPEGIG